MDGYSETVKEMTSEVKQQFGGGGGGLLGAISKISKKSLNLES